MSDSPLNRFRNLESVVQYSQTFYDYAYDCGIMGLYATPAGSRTLSFRGGRVVDFLSCSYLGLDVHPQVVEGAIKAISDYGVVQWSCSRTRLNYSLLDDLEDRLSDIWSGRVVIFTSTTLANIAGLALLAGGALTPRRPDIILFDTRCHASLLLMRPVVADETQVLTVSLQDRERIEDICLHNNCIAIVADGVHSMGGCLDFPFVRDLQERFGAILYIDDAHGVSIQGKAGCGVARSFFSDNFNPNIILVTSLAKGFGASGGAIIVRDVAQEHAIRRFGPTYAFSALPSVASVGAALGSAHVHETTEIDVLQQKLYRNIEVFDSEFKQPWQRDRLPIRFIPIGDEERMLGIAKDLLDLGYYVMAAFFPTVAKKQSGLRVSLSAGHEEDMVRTLARAIIAKTQG